MISDKVFTQALDKVLKHEGGYNETKGDRGGATNFGVSLKFLSQNGDINGDGVLDFDIDGDNEITAEDIQQLKREDAERIYYELFWKPNRYDQIRYPAIAIKVFDLAVNMGWRQANKILQRAMNAVMGQNFVAVDGVIGPKTLDALNSLNVTNGAMVMPVLVAEAAAYYRLIIALNPVLKKFENGWMNRAYS